MKTHFSVNGWLIPLAIGGGIVAYLLGIFLPGHRALAVRSHDLSSKETLVAAAGNLAPAVQAVQEELECTVRYNHRWSEAAPSAHDVSNLFGRINALAKSAGLKTTRFDPEPIERLERIRRIPVRLGCHGMFSQVCRFLQDLEALDTATWVNRLQIEESGKDGNSVQLDLDLVIFADNLDISGQVSRRE